MYNTLIKYINSHIIKPLEENEIDIVKNSFIPKKLKKHQFFLEEGDISKYLGFIINGSMKKYSLNNKGKEHIINLYIERWWVGDRESFAKLTPSLFNITACEDTELLILSKNNSAEVFSLPFMIDLKRQLDENHSIANQRRINAAINMTAEERYNMLLSSYPEFLQRFPQHMVASYLGIANETFSRIRSRSVK